MVHPNPEREQEESQVLTKREGFFFLAGMLACFVAVVVAITIDFLYLGLF